MDGKRERSPTDDQLVVLKKAKGLEEGPGSIVLSRSQDSASAGPKRTSKLHAPIMLLTGHASEIFTTKFSPDGQVIASGGADKRILLWRVYGPDCPNYMMIEGHRNAILELQWTQDGERLISCSPDKSVRAWDATTGLQVKKMREHEAFVNSCCPLRRGPPLVASGSDDGVVKVFDLRQKRSAKTFRSPYPVTCVAFGEGGEGVYGGGTDNDISYWDLRTDEVALTLSGHSDTVTGLRISPDGTHLLSNAMDNTLRIWDLRPYAPKNRCTKVLTGHVHSFEKHLLKCDWSPDGARVAAGSADRMVYIWETSSRRILYKLPGHQGSVNEVVFHPTEPIVGSAGSDRQIYLGEVAASTVPVPGVGGAAV